MYWYNSGKLNEIKASQGSPDEVRWTWVGAFSDFLLKESSENPLPNSHNFSASTCQSPPWAAGKPASYSPYAVTDSTSPQSCFWGVFQNMRNWVLDVTLCAIPALLRRFDHLMNHLDLFLLFSWPIVTGDVIGQKTSGSDLGLTSLGLPLLTLIHEVISPCLHDHICVCRVWCVYVCLCRTFHMLGEQSKSSWSSQYVV